MTTTRTAAILIVGNEILSGRTQDKNIAYIAEKLSEVGVRLSEVRIIPDVEEVIVRTLNELRGAFDYVFTTGGIGPTHDDITADCVARAFGVALPENAEARRRLEVHYANTDLELNEARLRMARIPEGAVLVDNPVSAAPGFQIDNVFVMAGVPKIMQSMLSGILPQLEGGPPLLSITIRSTLPEGKAAAGLATIATTYPDLDFGSYPAWTQSQFKLSIVVRGQDKERLEAAVALIEAMVRDLGDTPELLSE